MFAAITHELTENFYFAFYSERLNTMWIMSYDEFLAECVTYKNGKNAGKYSIWFNGNRKSKEGGKNIVNRNLKNMYVKIFQGFIRSVDYEWINGCIL